MSLVFCLLPIAATFFVAFHFQAKKELTVLESQYRHLSSNDYNIGESNNNHDLQLFYEKIKYHGPYGIDITITNTGNQEITENDFRSDKFEILFNKDIILYDASVTNATTQNLEKEITSKLEIKDNRLLISPFLLNRKESFTLSLITTDQADIDYSFRIVGISKIKWKTEDDDVVINYYYPLGE